MPDVRLLPRCLVFEPSGPPRSTPPVSGKLRENECGDASKMKVHPAMLMKKNKGGCRASGARSQAFPLDARYSGRAGHPASTPASFRKTGGKRAWRCIENEGSSGYVNEKKQRWVPGIRCEVSGVPPRCAVFGPSGPSRLDTASFRETGGKRARQCIENEGSSGYVDENK